MNGFCFLLGLLTGAGFVSWIARRRVVRQCRQIDNIIHLNRHRHPALILERVQNHIAAILQQRF